MTQEERQILLQDLCARLPYGVMCDRLGRARKLVGVQPYKTFCIELDNGEYMPQSYTIEDVKPFLRPLSSMTPEEKDFYDSMFIEVEGDYLGMFPAAIIDWLNRKMFDYRGLISKGLALPAKDGMYN